MKIATIHGRRAIPLVVNLPISSKLKSKVATLRRCTHVLYGDKLLRVETTPFPSGSKFSRFNVDGKIRTVTIDYNRFVYDDVAGKFVSPPRNSNDCAMSAMHGKNTTEIRVPAISMMVVRRLFSMVWLINFLSMLCWVYFRLFSYLVLYLIFTIYDIYEDVSNEVEHYAMIFELSKDVRADDGNVREEELIVNGETVRVPAYNVHPGMRIRITRGVQSCDIRLSSGEVVVDESFLTGESLPITKGKDDIVFAGTNVIVSRGDSGVERSGASGVVQAISFNTAKGALLKSILNPLPPAVTFHREAVKTLAIISLVMSLLAIPMFLFVFKAGSIFYRLVHVLDSCLVVASPSLPAAVRVGILVAKSRIKNVEVFDKQRINSAGAIDVVVFDKTGTLTENSLDVSCVDTIVPDDDGEKASVAAIGMACCHDIISVDGKLMGDPLDMKIFERSGGRFKGEKIITRNGEKEVAIEKIKVFDFNNKLRRMSVLVRFDGSLLLFTKGSPESIKEVASETIPSNYDSVVKKYSASGFRVISVAYRAIESDEQIERISMEDKLSFVAIIVLSNNPKAGAYSLISELNEADLSTVMATGDGISTAISVSKKIGMVDTTTPIISPEMEFLPDGRSNVNWICDREDLEFNKVTMELTRGDDRVSYDEFVVAVDGNVYEYLRDDLEYHRMILEKGKVFARMNSEQKRLLVEDLSKNHTVCFVGDGANDCGALSSAEVGITLSDTPRNRESNRVTIECRIPSTKSFRTSSNIGERKRKKDVECIAAPFVSHCDLSAVSLILKEGRSALVCSVSQFKFILLTGVIQFVGICVSAFFRGRLSDNQFVLYDFGVVVGFCIIIGMMKSSKRLCKTRPPNRLLSNQFIYETAGMFLIIIICTLAPFFFIDEIRKECPVKPSGRPTSMVKQSTLLFFIATFLAMSTSHVQSESRPHREPKMGNPIYVTYTAILVSAIIFLFFSTNLKFIENHFGFVNITFRERLVVLVVCVAGHIAMTSWRRFSKRIGSKNPNSRVVQAMR